MQVSGGHTGRRESAPALLAGYESLLAHLKSQGALLNSVKPELLLDIADFKFAVLSHQLFIFMQRVCTDDTCIAAAELVYFEPHSAVMMRQHYHPWPPAIKCSTIIANTGKQNRPYPTPPTRA